MVHIAAQQATAMRGFAPAGFAGSSLAFGQAGLRPGAFQARGLSGPGRAKAAQKPREPNFGPFLRRIYFQTRELIWGFEKKRKGQFHIKT